MVQANQTQRQLLNSQKLDQTPDFHLHKSVISAARQRVYTSVRTFSRLSPAKASLRVVEIFIFFLPVTFTFFYLVTGYEGDREDNLIISFFTPQVREEQSSNLWQYKCPESKFQNDCLHFFSDTCLWYSTLFNLSNSEVGLGPRVF